MGQVVCSESFTSSASSAVAEMADQSAGPKDADAVIWELEPPDKLPAFLLLVEGAARSPVRFEDRDAWSRVYLEAKRIAGPERAIWIKRLDCTLTQVV